MRLCYEDCLKLEHKFPQIHREFLKGNVCVPHSNKAGSAVSVDRALEKTNKTAKGKLGVIGITIKKVR